MEKFKVGDKVKVVKKETLRGLRWLPSMDKCIGLTGKIISKHKNFTVAFQIATGAGTYSYTFNSESLELVNPQFEVGKIYKFKGDTDIEPGWLMQYTKTGINSIYADKWVDLTNKEYSGHGFLNENNYQRGATPEEIVLFNACVKAGKYVEPSKPRYKVGDIVVSIAEVRGCRVVGDMFKIHKTTSDSFCYKERTSSFSFNEWRHATNDERLAFENDGITNISKLSTISIPEDTGPEYVEFTRDICGYKTGDIGKVLFRRDDGYYMVNVPNRKSTSSYYPNVACSLEERLPKNFSIKPSTKEAYDKQHNMLDITSGSSTTLSTKLDIISSKHVFKVGDEVRILDGRKSDSGWTNEMDETIGEIGEIIEIEVVGEVWCIKIDKYLWNYQRNYEKGSFELYSKEEVSAFPEEWVSTELVKAPIKPGSELREPDKW